MRAFLPSRLLLLAVLLAGLVLPASAAVPTYASFQLQARSNLLVNDNGYNLPPGSSFNSISADIDDQARVSFPVQVVPDGASSRPGVWFGGNGQGGLVFQGPVDALISSETSHNAAGQIVFVLNDTAGADGIYRHDPAVPATTRLGTAPLFPVSYGSVRINEAGAVGWQGNFSGGRGLASTLAGSSLLHVVDRGLDPGSPWTFIYTPDFNGQRRMAAKVATSADFTSATEIRAFDSAGTSIRLAANRGSDPGSPLQQFDNGLAFADDGRVAFIASRVADGRRAVYRASADGSVLTEIAVANPAGPIAELEFFRPALNSAGLVAFRAREPGGAQAIFVGDGSTLRRVVGRGDVLATDLGTAQVGQNNNTDAVFAGAPALNARGDLAFVAALHPQGNNQVEWGSGVFVAYAETVLFADGFETAAGR